MQEPEEVPAEPTAAPEATSGTTPTPDKPTGPRAQVEEFPDPIELDEEIWDRVWDQIAAERRVEKEVQSRAEDRAGAEDQE